ncbi:precorrin-2 C(20)-methyltransferase [Beijerinckia sp. L45]|uniref:precorrin-2 C(20)-methyltransferase n=1 Tax=Beijerinckia sp. L45 TaxID=1641855 RepID=UPI00131B2711|nr:precorrin-2 C(20)-methyltransferase [Beijerinckia sp. L45]
MSTGRLYGIGLGPGDPELMTLKAVRCLQAVSVVAYFAKCGKRGHARTIADHVMPAGCAEVPMVYPVTTEIPVHHADYAACLAPFYEEQAATLAAHLDAGRDVALLCEGDPLFYGSFMHLYIRLRARFAVTIVPGISGMSGCWSAAGLPITWGDDVLTVLPGTLSADALRDKLAGSDAAVIMKLGSNFAKVRAAIDAAGLLDEAVYVERGSMQDEIVLPLRDKHDGVAPYFSIILIPGHGRRP